MTDQNNLHWICRARTGKEEHVLRQTAKRCQEAWMPWSFTSLRTGRGKTTKYQPLLRPVMPLMFCTGTRAEFDNVMAHRLVYGPTWFIPPRQAKQLRKYRLRVESEFRRAHRAYKADTRTFHCQYKAGQLVRAQLTESLEHMLPATFVRMLEGGQCDVRVEMLGSVRTIRVDHDALSLAS